MDGTVPRTTTAPDHESEQPAGIGEACAEGDGLGAATEESPDLVFSSQFTSSPGGAQLVRRLTVCRLREWGYPPSSDTSRTIALVVAELAANAVRHGRVPGRNAHLRIARDVRTRLIRIDVSDASPTLPRLDSAAVAGPEDESGRCLFLVASLATCWGAALRTPIGTTVWAEVAVETPEEK